MGERELRSSLRMTRVHLCGTKAKPREELDAGWRGVNGRTKSLDARLGASPGTGRSLETVGVASPIPRVLCWCHWVFRPQFPS